MDYEKSILLHKIQEVNAFLYQNYHFQKVENLIGDDANSPQRQAINKFAKELAGLYEKAQPFSPDNPEDLSIRNQALCQLQVFKMCVDASNLQVSEKSLAPEGNPLRKAQEESIAKYELAKIKIQTAFGGLDWDNKDITSQLDINKITWINLNSGESILGAIGSKNVNSALLEAAYSTNEIDFQKGLALSSVYLASMKLIPTPDGKSFTYDANGSNISAIEGLLSYSSVKDMISNFKKSEEYWLSSGLPASVEMQNRINFVRAYKNELSTLNTILELGRRDGTDYPKILESVIEKNGLKELLKDYKTVFPPKTENPDPIFDGMNDAEKGFRNLMKEHALKTKDQAIKSPEILRFHRELLSGPKADNGLSYAQTIMNLPEKTQLKVLYQMEHSDDLRIEMPGDEFFDTYKPDMDKAIDNVKCSKFKFWKYMAGTQLNMGLIKDCVDKVVDGKEFEDPELKKEPIQRKLEAKGYKYTGLILGKIVNKLKNLTVVKLAKSFIGLITKDKDHKYMTEAQRDAEHVENAVTIAEKMESATLLTGNMAAWPLASLAKGALSITKESLKIWQGAKRDDLMRDIQSDIQWMQRQQLTDEQSELLKKIQIDARVAIHISEDKAKMAGAEIFSGACEVLSTALMLSGVGAVASTIPALIGGISSSIYKNVKDAQDLKEIVDIKLFDSIEKKHEVLEKTKQELKDRFARMNDVQKKKYGPDLQKALNDEETLKEIARAEYLRTEGGVDMPGLRNQIINKIGEDTFDLLKHVNVQSKINKPPTEIDIKMREITAKFLVAVGAKTSNLEAFTFHEVLQQEEKQAVVNDIKNSLTF